jgi:hypothetical protein
MTYLRATLCALVLLGVAFSGTLTAQEQKEGEHQKERPCCGMMSEGEHGMQGMHMQHMDPMMHVAVFAPPHLLEQGAALELTDEQVSRLEGLGNELMEQHREAAAEAKQHHEQAMQLWKQDAPDVDQLRQHAQAALRAEENAKLALLTVAAQAKAVLTPEQQERVAGMMHEHMEHMEHMMHGGEGHMERHQP